MIPVFSSEILSAGKGRNGGRYKYRKRLKRC